mgnify:CR=1 FL=1
MASTCSAITGPATIAVNTSQTVGYLRFANTNTVTIGAAGGSNLTLENGASIPSAANASSSIPGVCSGLAAISRS